MPKRGATGGFALIEVLVAALVLAAMLGAYFASASASLSAERQIAARREAALVARSVLDAGGAPGADAALAGGGRSGRYRWQVSVAPWPQDDGGAALERVEVVVTADGEARPLIRLATLRLAP